MKIQDVLNKNVMLFDLQATDKEGVINAALRGQQEPSDHGDQVAKDDAWFRYLQVLLKHTRRS